jgi:hypothetical protein
LRTCDRNLSPPADIVARPPFRLVGLEIQSLTQSSGLSSLLPSRPVADEDHTYGYECDSNSGLTEEKEEERHDEEGESSRAPTHLVGIQSLSPSSRTSGAIKASLEAHASFSTGTLKDDLFGELHFAMRPSIMRVAQWSGADMWRIPMEAEARSSGIWETTNSTAKGQA